MVTSKFLTNQMDWPDRIAVMQSNLDDECYSYLYFNIVLNMLDAKDNADYDKENILESMLIAFKRGAMGSVQNHIYKLKELI